MTRRSVIDSMSLFDKPYSVIVSIERGSPGTAIVVGLDISGMLDTTTNPMTLQS